MALNNLKQDRAKFNLRTALTLSNHVSR